MSLCAEN